MGANISKQNDEILRFFDEKAFFWAEKARDPQRREFVREILGRFLKIDAGIALDIGCGGGIVSQVLVERGWKQEEIIMIDPSFKLVSMAREKLSACFGLAAFGEKLPIKSERANLAIIFNALPHMQIDAVLNELRRTLKVGGQLLIFHDNGSEQINEIHRNIGGPIKEHILPSVEIVARKLDKLGFRIYHASDKPHRHYIISAINGNYFET